MIHSPQHCRSIADQGRKPRWPGEGRNQLPVFAFLLLPGFSALSLEAMREPLRETQFHAGRSPGRTWLFSLDGEAVRAGDGTVIDVNGGLQDPDMFDVLVICGGEDVIPPTSELVQWLDQTRSRRKMIGAVDGGCGLMAEVGLLNGYRCTAHWRFLESLGETYPQLRLRRSLFEIDRDRFTCSGGLAGLDLILELIQQDLESDTTRHCLDYFCKEKHRGGGEKQQLPSSPANSVTNPRLIRALEWMQENLEAELSTAELAEEAGCSRRQLERLFRRFLGMSPMVYRQELRLWRAWDLLLRTRLSITQVAMASGFSSNAHFSARFKARFGRSPRQARQMPSPVIWNRDRRE